MIRNEAAATFIWVSARDFYRSGAFGSFTYAFDLARELAPSVLFFEDVDTWIDSYTVDLLKTEMDGIGRSAGVWTVLTTNFPEQLPEALIDRPGRFHDCLKFDLPDESARGHMVRRWLPEVDSAAPTFALAVRATDGYSGAYVYELCHFAKTLKEQEAKSIDDAVALAVDKIKAQKELIQSRSHRRRRGLDDLPVTRSLVETRSFGRRIEEYATVLRSDGQDDTALLAKSVHDSLNGLTALVERDHAVVVAKLDDVLAAVKPTEPEATPAVEPAPSVTAAVKAPAVDPAVVAALQSLVAANQKIQNQFHRLTGKKV